MRRAKRIGLGLAVVAVVVLVTAVVTVTSLVRGSLPRLTGTLSLEGPVAPIDIERDAIGVPTLRAENRADLAFGLGFLHAQDRFFSMDLTRRAAAGELAGLFGPIAVGVDRDVRVHRFRAVATEVVARFTPREREVVNAYTRGVNAGLQSLRSRPFEYWLLRQKPRPWEPVDCVLVVLAMFLDLQDDRAQIDTVRGILSERVSPAWQAFLLPEGDRWEAPVQGTPGIPAAIPLQRLSSRPGRSMGGEAPSQRGSNGWAIAGNLTEHGGAIVANDMHLGLRVPNIWYRARGTWVEAGQAHDVTGVTLPGAPAFIIGSNRFLAWGFTNSYGDWLDWIDVDVDGSRYRTENGWEDLAVHVEVIEVAGAEPESFQVLATKWGPLVENVSGRDQALRWVAHLPSGVNFRLLELERVHQLEVALDLAPTCGIPGQNFVVAHRDGSIGWTIMGRVPRRVGFDGRTPVSWADGETGWQGWLSPSEVPRVVNPPDGRIWTANARVTDRVGQSRLGDSGFAQGARAQQIRDNLLSRSRWDEAGCLDVQLDDRAVFLDRWRTCLLDVLERTGQHSDVRDLIRGPLRAQVDSAGYRLVRAFRLEVHDRLLSHWLAPLEDAIPEFPRRRLPRRETPVWSAVEARAPHLLPPGDDDWDAFLVGCLEAARAELRPVRATAAELVWGDRNSLSIRHPLSGAVGPLASFLDMPATPVAGDSYMPRVQGPAFGASERMAVSPGREEAGYLQMPTGASGHPWSPYYRAGHDDWVDGTLTPFLPGPTEKTLRLVPTQ